jgi:hypothetical protein
VPIGLYLVLMPASTASRPGPPSTLTVAPVALPASI